jgi:hypothetical protein
MEFENKLIALTALYNSLEQELADSKYQNKEKEA